MNPWIIFCSSCIPMNCEALIMEGCGKTLAAMVAIWSILATLISTQFTAVFPWLDGREAANLTVRQTSDWTVFDRPTSAPIVVHAYKQRVLVMAPRTASELAAEHEQSGSKIDYVTTCGSDERRIDNRLDIAQINKKSTEQALNDRPC